MHLKKVLVTCISLSFLMFFAPVVLYASYRDLIQAETGLLYYWPMGESVGATSSVALVGSTAIDLIGATTGVPGQVDGTAVSFDGVDDYGVTSTTTNLTAHSQIIVEALMSFNSFSISDNKLAWIFGSAYNTVGNFVFAPNSTSYSGLSIYHWGNNSALNFAVFTKPSINEWHHVVAVYDKTLSADEVNLYIDGELQTATSRPNNYNSTNKFGNLLLHLMTKDGATPYGAKMQHFAIYSSLSTSTILAHAQATGILQLTAGVLSDSSHTESTAVLSWTNSTKGVGPVTQQLQRSLHNVDEWEDVSGGTLSPATDTGLATSTSYDYRVAYTDSVLTLVYSNIINITTDAPSNTITYVVGTADLWDNGYDNTSQPLQSNAARLIFTTDAGEVTVTGYTTLFNDRPLISHLGFRINGVNQSPLIFTKQGTEALNLNLGATGTMRTIEIVNGHQSTLGLTTVLGSYISSITYPISSSFSVETPVINNRLLIYGDSISGGSLSTNPESDGYGQLLRNEYGYNVMLESWGNRSFYEDVHTSELRNSFVSRIASYTPSTIWLAIGTNDYGYYKWSAASFGIAYAAVVDALHIALPASRIICQTPIIRGGEAANSLGDTLDDYRDQITTICNAQIWTTLVDGKTILATSDLIDGVHPTTAGHAKYASRVDNILTIPPMVVSLPASSVSTSTASFVGSITSVGSTTPVARGFIYGLTDMYEIGTTTESGFFNTGDFNYLISDLASNTVYHYKSYVTNFAGTGYGEGSSFYTLAPIPTNLSTTTVEKTSITLMAESFQNDTASSSGYLFSREGADSGWIQNNTWQDTGLTCNTDYLYSVKYRNGDGVETEPISITQKTTSCGGGSSHQMCTYTYTDWGSCIDGEQTRTVSTDYTSCSNIETAPMTQRCTIPVATSTIQVVTTTATTTPQNVSTTVSDPNSMNLSDFINLLINLGIISPDKANSARLLISSTTTLSNFTKDLKFGQIDPEVKRLQIFLNTQGYNISASGVGSPGKETTYFGLKTKDALIKFQEAHFSEILKPANFKRGTGMFGAYTRNFVNSLLGK